MNPWIYQILLSMLSLSYVVIANSLTWIIKRSAQVKSTVKVFNIAPVQVDADWCVEIHRLLPVYWRE